LAKRLVQIVKNGKDPVSRQQGYFAAGNVEFWRGEFENSRRYLERAVHEYRSDQHEELIGGYGENCFATSGSYLSWTLSLLGLPRQAMQTGERALEEARRTAHPFSLGYALTFHTVLHRILRQPRNTLDFAEQTIDLAQEHNLPLWEVGATLKKGWAQVLMGDLQGLDLMQWSVEQVSSLMSAIAVIFFETQADGLYYAGRFRESLDAVDRGLEQVERLDDHHAEAELYRLKGRCLLELSNDNLKNAEECFRRALQISRRQKALLFELRAAMALADLRIRQLKPQEGLPALAHVYNQFSEGFSFPDLVAAQRMLAGFNV
jgi:predicted ATPase